MDFSRADVPISYCYEFIASRIDNQNCHTIHTVYGVVFMLFKHRTR